MKESKPPGKNKRSGRILSTSLPPPVGPHKKKQTINMIYGGFAAGGATNGDQEVYAINISTEVALGRGLN